VNLETIQAVIAAAEAKGAPIVLQVSPGAIAYAGFGPIGRLVVTAAAEARVPVVAHVDHCRELDTIERALEAGFGSVMFDGSRLPLDENVRLTRETLHRASARGAAVEAELGVIGGPEDTTSAMARYAVTTPAEAAAFIEACPVDVLAPALGTIHRMPDDSVRLDLDLIEAIARATRTPLALHGGSGVDQRDLSAAFQAGVVKLNISSRVGRAFATGIRSTWESDPGQTDPRRFLGAGRDAVREMAERYIDLTGSAGRVVPAAPEPGWTSTVTEVE
jgi:tagatose 1,6-diphosphate aldolase GatY/KbaY